MYLGTQPSIGQNRKIDSIASSFNGVLTTFSLTVNTSSIVPSNVYQLFISLGGVLQNPGVDFTVNGNQITFTTAPTAGLSFFGIFQGDSITGTPTIADASITTAKLATGLTVTHTAGTAGAPSVTFAGDTANGAFAPAANTFGIATGGSERLRVTSAGEVFVAGTTDQGAYNIQCNGTGVWGAGAYVNGSDENLKENIQDLAPALEIIKTLRPVTFQYKEEYSKDTNVQTGFIAQELQEALADEVYLNGIVQAGPKYLNVAYQGIIAILVKAVQELDEKVKAFENQEDPESR